MTVALVVNPHSGTGSEPAHLADLFAQNGLTVDVMPIGDDGPTATAEQAIARGASTVIAAGGDGTVGAVASALVGTECTLGVLPAGTLNHFAHDLGIPGELDAAVKVIAAGKTAQVDVADLNGRVFVNNSSLGVYPQVVRLREHQQKHRGWSKWTALFWALLATIRRIPFLALRLTADAAAIVRRTPMIFIGNNEYALEGLRAGTREHIAGGTLCVHVVNARNGFELVRRSIAILLGLKQAPNAIESVSTSEAWIESRRPFVNVSMDGEVVRMQPPLHYRIRPGALRVLVP